MLELNVRCTDENQVTIMASRDILSLTVRSKSDRTDHVKTPRLRTGNFNKVSISLASLLAVQHAYCAR